KPSLATVGHAGGFSVFRYSLPLRYARDQLCPDTRPSSVRYQDNDTGSERSATGALAVSAVAVEHRDWRARAHIADRSACTPAGEWSSHVEFSSCRLTMRVRSPP